MAQEFRINIVVDPTNARRGLGTVESGLNRLLGLVQRLLALLGFAAGVREIFKLIDAFNVLENRLRVVTAGQAALGLVTEKLFDIANRTRSSFESTAELYGRLAINARELGRSQNQLLQFTETLNKAIILSGANALEAKAGLIQFSQGLASNTLRGDELRAVLEQLPVIADIIAKSLGVTRGQLRILGQEGKITGDVILRAFEQAREEIDDRFARTIPTIGQSVQVLVNKFQQLLGNFSNSNAVTKTLTTVILKLADNIDLVARSIAFLTVLIGVNFVSKGIEVAIAGLGRLAVALFTNPLTFLPAIIAAAVAALITFGDKISLGGERMANLQDLAVSALDEIGKRFGDLFTLVEEGFQRVPAAAQAASDETDGVFVGFLKDLAGTVDGVLGVITGVVLAQFALYTHLPAAIADVFVTLVNFIAGGINSALAFVTAALRNMVGLAIEVGASLINFFGGLGKAGKQAFEGNFTGAVETAKQAVNGLGLQVKDALTQAPAKFLNDLDDLSKNGLIPKIKNNFVGGAKELGESVVQGFVAGFKDNTALEFLNKILGDAENRAKKRAEESARAAKERADALKGLDVTPEKVTPRNIALEQEFELLRKQADMLRLGNREREIQNGLLQIEQKLKGANVFLTEEERRSLETQLRINQALKDQGEALDSITKPQEDLLRRHQALKQLLYDGRISQEQYNVALRQTGLEKVNFDLEQQAKLLQLSNREREVQAELLRTEEQLRQQGKNLSDAERSDLEDQLRLVRSLSEQSAILDQLRGPQETFSAGLENINHLLEIGAINVDEYNKLLLELTVAANESGTSIESGFTRGFAKVQLELNDLASLTENVLVNAFHSAEDALVEFATTGKLNFSKLVDSILADVARLLVRQGLNALLGALGAGIGGGFFGGAGAAAATGESVVHFAPPEGFAGGGNVLPNVPIIVGERGTEIFNPHTSGSIIPHHALAQGSTSNQTFVPVPPPQVHVSVVNISDPNEATAALDTPEGEKKILNVITRNRSAVKRGLG